MITLDGDQVTQEFVDEFEKRVDFAAVLFVINAGKIRVEGGTHIGGQCVGGS